MSDLVTMKCLSIKQPWASLIVNGYKDIENRSWPTTFRGRFLVHAGKKHDGDFDFDWAHKICGVEFDKLGPFERGGIVGMSEITDCVKESKSPWFFGDYGFVLGRSRALPFMPLKGQLSFFNGQYDKELLST